MPNLKTQILFFVLSRMSLILTNVVVQALLWGTAAKEQLLRHSMLFASKTEGYLIIADPSKQSFSLPVHMLLVKQITDLTLEAEAALWSLSGKLHTAKQSIF